MRTIKQLLGKAQKSFSGLNVLEIELIAAFVLGLSREDLLKNGDDHVSVDEEKLFDFYLGRLQDGEPYAYIVNEKEFFGLNFFVDNRVLVPRPETEVLVTEVLNYPGRLTRIMDLGTGSGNIAISIAKNLIERGAQKFQIEALDISEDALEVAKINIAQHDLEQMVVTFQSDLLEILENDEKYDVIVANLPYIGENKNFFIAENVKNYEPKVALYAGDDGLMLYKKLFQQIKDKNIDFDLLIGEFDPSQINGISLLLDKYFIQEIRGKKWQIKKDLMGNSRMFVVEKEMR